MKNTEIIEDITDKLESPLPLFGEEESKNGIDYNDPIDSDGPDPQHKYLPSYIEDQIKSNGPPPSTSPTKNINARSSKFDFLLSQPNEMPPQRDNFNAFVSDLAGGDMQLEQDNKKAREQLKAQKKAEKEA